MKLWSYVEDIKLVENGHLAAREVRELLNCKRSIQVICRRRIRLGDMNADELVNEEKFIIDSYGIMTEQEIAEKLYETPSYVRYRIMSLAKEGKLKKVVASNYKSIDETIEPMKEKMIVGYKQAPKKALSKVEIQKDRLKVDETYTIYKVNSRNKSVKKQLRLLSCYKDYYLFQDVKGLKYTLNKIDYFLGGWKVCK